MVSPHALVERLTPRRRQILALVAKGLTNDDIAGVLAISQHTVRTHLTTLFAQLEVTNRTEAATTFLAWEARPARIAEVLSRPAIAVLPFIALDGEPRARNVATGVAHDLAALFARWCWFPVIANTSTAGVRNGNDTSLAIGRLLGARFIVDGDLRLDDRSCRLSVRIDDVETDQLLWTDRVDFPRDGLFAVQDALCEAMVAEAYPVLVAQVLSSPARQGRHPEDLGAWELSHSAMALHATREQAANHEARSRFGAALAREPGLVLAHFGLGLASYDELLNQWGRDVDAADRLATCATRCLELAPHSAEGHYLVARHAQAAGDHEGAIPSLEKAVSHNPSFAMAHALLAQVLAIAGRGDEALTRMKHAVRLGPRAYVAGLAALHFSRHEYADALKASERAVASNPRYAFARVLAAASAWWLGDRERAQQHRRALDADPASFDAARFLARFGTGVETVERLAVALEALAAK